MKSIKNNISNEIIIKNSRFICLLIKINNSNIDNIMNSIKNKYPKATHYCYGYILNNYEKSSDDGEPSSTAGMPILNVLKKENLCNVLCVVVRYFGGIKLGAGGLIRAYTKSVTEALKKALFVKLEKGYKVSIIFPYNLEKQVNYILNKSNIISREYRENITYLITINDEVLKKLNNFTITNKITSNIIEETYIEVSI